MMDFSISGCVVLEPERHFFFSISLIYAHGGVFFVQLCARFWLVVEEPHCRCFSVHVWSLPLDALVRMFI
jgi:hypothetical protein